MLKQIIKAAAFLSALLLFAAENHPVFRFTNKVPFQNGKKVAELWRKTDILTRFVTVVQYDVANFQSEIQGMYDNNNLYITVRGSFNPKHVQSFPEKSLFGNNNFEIFIQPDSDGPYIQVAVDDNGRVYTARDAGEIALPGARVTIEKGNDFWIANLTLPFEELRMKVPDGDKAIRFCVMRNNVNTFTKKPEVSSFVPIKGSYHVPAIWAQIKMTKTPATKDWNRVFGPDQGMQINLMQNPDFFNPITVNPNDQELHYMETQALTDDWILRVSGKKYFFHSFRPYDMQPETEYTLRIRARNFGGEGNLMVILLNRVGNGFKEGTYLTGSLTLTPEFNEYFIPFKTNQEHPWTLAFYKKGGNAPDKGIDLASVRLYKGKIASFEIRGIQGVGGLASVRSTTPIIPPSSYGKSDKKIRVLVLLKDSQSIYEAREIFSGSGIQFDCITVSKNNSDIYSSDGNTKDIQETLIAQGYDAFIIGRNCAEKVGPTLYDYIAENIKKGSGAYVFNASEAGRFAKLLKEAQLAPATENAPQLQAFPGGMFPLKDETNPTQSLMIGKFGAGTVVYVDSPSKSGTQLQFRIAGSEAGFWKFPHSQYSNAWIVRQSFLLSGKQTVQIDSVKIDNGKVTVRGNLQGGTVLVWKVLDQGGTVRAFGKDAFTTPETVLALPQVTSSGRHYFSVHALDKNGATIDYNAASFSQTGAKLSGFIASKESYRSNETGEFSIEVSNLASGLSVDWTLADFSGRILEKGRFKAAQKNTFRIPFDAMFTNMGKIRMELKQNDKVLHTQVQAVYVRDLDMKRTMSDYTPGVWPAGVTSPEGSQIVANQLESIGIRHFLISYLSPSLDLSYGFSLGGGWIGGYENFGSYPQKSNIRAQQFNTVAARKRIAETAEKRTKSYARYGIIHQQICDEPQFTKRGTSWELDAHPENIAKYRQYMGKKYDTIVNYNKRHQTSYGSFADLDQAVIQEARASGKYAEFIEWRNFNVDRWCEAIKLVSEHTRKIDPDTKFALLDSFGQGAFDTNDYWKLNTKAGLDMSMDYTSMVYFSKNASYNFDEFYRSFAPEMKVWGFTGYFFNRSRANFMPWWFAAHRYGGFCWFAAYSPGYNLLDISTLALTKDAVDLRNSLNNSKLLEGVGKIFTDFQWRKNDVAIYYSYDSMLLNFAFGKETKSGEIHPSGPLHDYFYSRQGAQYLLEELLWQYEFLAQEQIAKGKLKEYKVLLLPKIIAMSDIEVTALKNFLKTGGKLIADDMPGLYDELGVKRAQAPFSASEVTIIGRNFSELDKTQKILIKDFLLTANCKPILESKNIVDFSGREAMQLIRGDMSIFSVLRMPGRSDDEDAQTFVFPMKGHVYDIRAGKYLDDTDTVTVKVPHADAVLFGMYPYKVEKLKLEVPEKVKAGDDLEADIAVVTSKGRAGQHVFHIQVLNPDGKARFHMKRNVSALQGEYKLKFRMAFNDPKGLWTIKVDDAMTGITTEKMFSLQ